MTGACCESSDVAAAVAAVAELVVDAVELVLDELLPHAASATSPARDMPPRDAIERLRSHRRNRSLIGGRVALISCTAR